MESLSSNFNVALLQINATGTLEGNLEKGIESCKIAKEKGADIAVFPEMYSNGYEHIFYGYLNEQKNIEKEKVEKWQQNAINDQSNFIQSFKNTAKDLKMAIAITYLEEHIPQPKNTVAIIDKNGEIILKYSKVHTVDFKMETYTEPGSSFNVCELDYGRGKVKLGAMICYDRDFPESARILMLEGAEIILVPNACYMKDIILCEQKIRAYENMVGIVTVNYPNERNKGRSSAYSPIVENEDEKEIDSKLLVMGEKEGIEIVSFNMEEIRKYRHKYFLGDSYRKPYNYKKLIENNPIEPFIRQDARR